MKKIILVLISALLFMFASAQDKAKTILDSFNKSMKSHPSIDIRFTFTTDDAKSNTNEVKNGRVLSKGNAFKLTMDDVEVFSDGKTKWTVLHDVGEINIQDVDTDSNDILDNPINFFTVNSKDFSYSYKGSVIVGGKTMEKIEFQPKDKKAAYSAVELQLEKATLHPYQVSYIGREGHSYSVRVKSFVSGTSIDSMLLIFNQSSYSDYEVIDLR